MMAEASVDHASARPRRRSFPEIKRSPSLLQRMRLAEFDENAARRLRVEESDQAAAGPFPSMFVNQSYAFGFEISESRLDIGDAVRRMVQFRRRLTAIAGDR
jgi:hypothetical protein